MLFICVNKSVIESHQRVQCSLGFFFLKMSSYKIADVKQQSVHFFPFPPKLS